MDKTMLKKWLKCGFIFKMNFSQQKGVGGIISPILANMALDGIQDLLAKNFPITTKNGKEIRHKINLVRYADDFIITGDSEDILRE